MTEGGGSESFGKHLKAIEQAEQVRSPLLHEKRIKPCFYLMKVTLQQSVISYVVWTRERGRLRSGAWWQTVQVGMNDDAMEQKLAI